MPPRRCARSLPPRCLRTGLDGANAPAQLAVLVQRDEHARARLQELARGSPAGHLDRAARAHETLHARPRERHVRVDDRLDGSALRPARLPARRSATPLFGTLRSAASLSAAQPSDAPSRACSPASAVRSNAATAYPTPNGPSQLKSSCPKTPSPQGAFAPASAAHATPPSPTTASASAQPPLPVPAATPPSLPAAPRASASSSSAPAMIWNERRPHSAARSQNRSSKANRPSSSPVENSSAMRASNCGPSGANPYGPSSFSLCERSPLATNTARRPSVATARATMRPTCRCVSNERPESPMRTTRYAGSFPAARYALSTNHKGMNVA